ncbi:MAG: hypothetical protein WB612_09710 [Nitrososphaeraceae archaeon]
MHQYEADPQVKTVLDAAEQKLLSRISDSKINGRASTQHDHKDI